MARQQARLADLVRFARAQSPLYRDLYRHLPVHVADLRQLPPVTKPQLMARFDEWVTDPAVTRAGIGAYLADPSLVGQRYLGRYTVLSTSGVTGDRGIFLHDPDAVAVYRALADAAPPDLRADAELLVKTYQDDREAIARAGWTPRAVLSTLADDLEDDDYLNAAGHQMTYLNDVCHIDPANPVGLPPPTTS